jgi:hypothetical protein
MATVGSTFGTWRVGDSWSTERLLPGGDVGSICTIAGTPVSSTTYGTIASCVS